MAFFDIRSVSDAELGALCNIDPTVDPSCSCLISDGGPKLNSDISGPGVRISFYLQALFLGLLAVRSGSLEEIASALYTLIATNVSMAITSLILGFKHDRGMSLHDAIVVCYLLAGSWFAIFSAMPSYNRFVKSDTTLQALAIIHSYIVFAFILAVLIAAQTFGNTPRCNSHAVAVIFYRFPFLNAGRIVAFVVVALTICIYSFISVGDYYNPNPNYYNFIITKYNELRKRRARRKEEQVKEKVKLSTQMENNQGPLPDVTEHLPAVEQGLMVTRPSHQTFARGDRTQVNGKLDDEPHSRGQKKRKTMKERCYGNPNVPNAESRLQDNVFKTGVHGGLLIEILVIILLWSLFVMHTELLIRWNRFEGGGGDDASWSFGQILPMFLVVLPFVQLVKVFKKLKLKKRPHRVHKHRHGYTNRYKPSRRKQKLSENAQDRWNTHGGAFGGSHAPPPADRGWPSYLYTKMSGPSNRPSGAQPSARISEHSLHSENIAASPPSRREAEDSEADPLGRSSFETSSSTSTSSTSSPNCSTTERYCTPTRADNELNADAEQHAHK